MGVFLGVSVMVGVNVGHKVWVGVAGMVDVADGVIVSVCVGEVVMVGVGGSPITVKYPDCFHSVPTNICTS